MNKDGLISAKFHTPFIYTVPKRPLLMFPYHVEENTVKSKGLLTRLSLPVLCWIGAQISWLVAVADPLIFYVAQQLDPSV